jgi:hypothetical protein
MMSREIAIGISVILFLASCDDEDHADINGGGPGSSDPNAVVTDSTNGFCNPVGGTQNLGTPSWTSGMVTANIDFDGDPDAQGKDPDWQPGTSGTVNGKAVNAGQYNYVVMSPGQMAASGVNLGDWATVTSNGKTVYARVEDRGPAGGVGEVSDHTADELGIGHNYLATYGNPQLDVTAYAGTASIQGDCGSVVMTQ